VRLGFLRLLGFFPALDTAREVATATVHFPFALAKTLVGAL
jgi:hypothetical protein